MIDRDHDLSITRQAELLEINRGTVYYLPRPVSAADLRSLWGQQEPLGSETFDFLRDCGIENGNVSDPEKKGPARKG